MNNLINKKGQTGRIAISYFLKITAVIIVITGLIFFVNGYYKEAVEVPDAEGTLLFWEILYGGISYHNPILDRTTSYIIDPEKINSSFLDSKLKSGDEDRSGAEIILYGMDGEIIAHDFYHENTFKNILPSSVGSGAGSSKLFYHSLYVLVGEERIPGRLKIATVVKVR